MLVMQYKTGVGAAPDWSSMTIGSDVSKSYNDRARFQNVGNGKIIGVYDDDQNNLVAELYSLTGTTINTLDTDSAFDAGGTVVQNAWGMSPVGDGTGKAIISWVQNGSSNGRLLVIEESPTDTLSFGNILTLSTNGRHRITALNETSAIDLRNQFSGSSYVEHTKINISGTTLSAGHTTNITNVYKGFVERFDDTHIAGFYRSVSPDRYEIRVYNVGASNTSQVGSSMLATGFDINGDCAIRRLRDDGDGIVFVAYNYSLVSSDRHVMAFKVDNTTKAITAGSAVTFTGTSYIHGDSERPLTPLTDTEFMINTRSEVITGTVSPSLVVTQNGTETFTSTSNVEIEYFSSSEVLLRIGSGAPKLQLVTSS